MITLPDVSGAFVFLGDFYQGLKPFIFLIMGVGLAMYILKFILDQLAYRWDVRTEARYRIREEEEEEEEREEEEEFEQDVAEEILEQIARD